MSAEKQVLCPSAPCREGAVLLGIVLPNGEVALAKRPPQVDGAFARSANAAGGPEARFRFASTCAQRGCSQWAGSRCGLIDRLASNPDVAGGDEGTLRPCPIRGHCRWYTQNGERACSVCTRVVTAERSASESSQILSEEESQWPQTTRGDVVKQLQGG